MKMIRRISAMTAAVLLLLASQGIGKAENTEEIKDERGRVASVTWRDDSGNVTAGPEGYAEIRYRYEGLKTTETYFDAEGARFTTAGGYCGRSVTKDGRGQIARIEYYGPDEKLIMNSQGYAAVNYNYFTFGPERTVVYFDADGKVTTVPSLGYAQLENLYTGFTLIGRSFMNEKGEPADSIRDGYATMTKKLNRKRTQILRVNYTHADGSPATGPDGWHRCESDLDKKDRVTETKYYDEQGAPTDKGGYAKETYLYSKGEVTVSRFDAAGNPVLFGGVAASALRKMKGELILSETYLDDAGRVTVLPEGYATAEYTYDKDGRITLVQYRDAAGNKVKNNQGYSAIRLAWDDRGRLTGREFLDEKGTGTKNAEGVSEEKYVYDADGRITDIVRIND